MWPIVVAVGGDILKERHRFAQGVMDEPLRECVADDFENVLIDQRLVAMPAIHVERAGPCESRSPGCATFSGAAARS